jgi:parallel beta-helix repeat protein
MKLRIVLSLLVSFALTFLVALALAGQNSVPVLAAPSATTWHVSTTGNDVNNCQTTGTACATIGAAIDKAADGDTIEIAAGTYHEHDVQISKQLTLNGAGAAATIVDADAAGRGFEVTSIVILSNLRLQNGLTPSGALFASSGGAVFVNGGAQLTLRNVTLIDNHAVGSGGAIFNIGKLTLENTEVLSNTADGAGGGLYNYNIGVMTVTQSSVAHNTALAYESGGGIYASGAGVSVFSSTIAYNTGATFGGGMVVSMNGATVLNGVTLSGNQATSGAALFSSQGVITATNTTVSGNNASNNYGGIYVTGAATRLFLKNSTIAYNTRTNTAGAGFNGLMIGDNAVVSLINTILAYNQSRNCASSAPPTSLGHNLSSDFNCVLTQSGDQQGVDPLLGPLADNGGDAATHALLPGSPAIDTGDGAQCPNTDARGVARPYDGDGNAPPVCDIGAVEARHRITIADSTVLEGNSGSITAVFTVTLVPTSSTAISLTYVTVSETAASGVDYTPASGVLTFNPGEGTKYINVNVTGDLADELNETFRVELATFASVDLLDAQAAGTIVDNDGLSALSIVDQSTLEGNSGTKTMPFVVTLSPVSPSVVTVTYATVAGTASAGSDYTTANGTLVFQPGQISKTISINVQGDLVDEGVSENFTVQLSNPINATLADGQAAGTITDDDNARLTQTGSPQVLEGDSGFTPTVFTITLSTSASFTISVDYDTSSGYGDTGAKAGEDFVPISGTLTFQPGVTLRTFTVQVTGDTLAESDEHFWSSISNANVPVDASVNSALILSDDDFHVYLPFIQSEAAQLPSPSRLSLVERGNRRH